MKATTVIYLGRRVERKHFRTFVYGSNGEKKLVESWSAFEAAIQSGIWFATKEDVELANKEKNEKPKKKYRKNIEAKDKCVEEVEDSEDALNGDVFEVTDY